MKRRPIGHLGDARERVVAESDHVEGKLAAFDRFERRVRGIDPVEAGTAATARVAGGGTVSSRLIAERSGDDRCRRVREGFAETVRPYSVEDVTEAESVVATIGEELGEEVALAVSPGGGGAFTPAIREVVLSAVGDRRSELRAMAAALEREHGSIRTTVDELDAALEAVEALGSRRLYRYGFGELRERHERLARFRERNERLARERQKLVGSTTSHGAATGIRHRTLLEYLYRGLSVDHPVLTAVVDFEKRCLERQRAIRDQLTRRV
jgi:hypothetical protein